MRVALVILAFALAAGCRPRPLAVACLGDSNTMADWPSGPTPRWCEYLARELPAWRVVNRGFNGATVCDFSRVATGFPWAIPQLEAARDDRPQIIVAAFGTNDIQVLHMKPDEIVACYRTLVAAAAPIRVIISSTPPMYPPMPDYAAQVDELNALLRRAFPPSQLIDFHDGFDRALFLPDGVHVGYRGQLIRAERARAALLAVAGGS